MPRPLACLLLVAVCSVAAAQTGGDREIAEGTTFVAGSLVPGRQPDGNSLLFRGPSGLVVFDSGRHAEHAQRLVDHARRAGLPVVAIVNSHWHLDHVAGNPLLRQAFPDLEVHASPAIEAAMRGFLANYRVQLGGMLERPEIDPAQRAAFEAEIARIDAGAALHPDLPVTAARTLQAGGRVLQLGLVEGAASGGDVFVFDPATRVLAAGDLVTLPVPFLDTACPPRWQAALGTLAEVDFALLVPGHGEPMTRAGFDRYRRAFDRLLACAAAAGDGVDCIEGWIADVGDLLPVADHAQARLMLRYYLDATLQAGSADVAARCAVDPGD